MDTSTYNLDSAPRVRIKAKECFLCFQAMEDMQNLQSCTDRTKILTDLISKFTETRIIEGFVCLSCEVTVLTINYMLSELKEKIQKLFSLYRIECNIPIAYRKHATTFTSTCHTEPEGSGGLELIVTNSRLEAGQSSAAFSLIPGPLRIPQQEDKGAVASSVIECALTDALAFPDLIKTDLLETESTVKCEPEFDDINMDQLTGDPGVIFDQEQIHSTTPESYFMDSLQNPDHNAPVLDNTEATEPVVDYANSYDRGQDLLLEDHTGGPEYFYAYSSLVSETIHISESDDSATESFKDHALENNHTFCTEAVSADLLLLEQKQQTDVFSGESSVSHEQLLGELLDTSATLSAEESDCDFNELEPAGTLASQATTCATEVSSKKQGHKRKFYLKPKIRNRVLISKGPKMPYSLHVQERLFTPVVLDHEYSVSAADTQTKLSFINKCKLTGKQPFICNKCGKAFKSLGCFKSHVKWHKVDNKCKQCGKVFMSINTLQKHKDMHRTNIRLAKEARLAIEKPHKCDVCGKAFKQPKSLKIHSVKHTGILPFKCNKCDCAFRLPSLLEQHMLTHSEDKHRCDVCGKAFKMLHLLKLHSVKHTGPDVLPFKCNGCERAFRRPEQLKSHLRTHSKEKLFKCEICGKAYKGPHSLRFHLKFHKGEVQPKSCSDCGRVFAHTSSLKLHIKRAHEQGQYVCDVCGKAFGMSSALQHHLTMHTGEKPFKCQECGKAFRCSTDMYRHSKTHSGQKPYLCDVCGKACTEKKKLADHIRTHTEKKPKYYNCSKCGKTLRNKYYLHKHTKAHHT